MGHPEKENVKNNFGLRERLSSKTVKSVPNTNSILGSKSLPSKQTTPKKLFHLGLDSQISKLTY